MRAFIRALSETLGFILLLPLELLELLASGGWHFLVFPAQSSWLFSLPLEGLVCIASPCGKPRGRNGGTHDGRGEDREKVGARDDRREAKHQSTTDSFR